MLFTVALSLFTVGYAVVIQKESYAIPRQNTSAYQYFGNGISISGNTALIGSVYGGALAGKYLKLLVGFGIIIYVHLKFIFLGDNLFFLTVFHRGSNIRVSLPER